MVRMFTNDPEDGGSIQCRVIPKTQKIVLDTMGVMKDYLVWCLDI